MGNNIRLRLSVFCTAFLLVSELLQCCFHSAKKIKTNYKLFLYAKAQAKKNMQIKNHNTKTGCIKLIINGILEMKTFTTIAPHER